MIARTRWNELTGKVASGKPFDGDTVLDTILSELTSHRFAGLCSVSSAVVVDVKDGAVGSRPKQSTDSISLIAFAAQ